MYEHGVTAKNKLQTAAMPFDHCDHSHKQLHIIIHKSKEYMPSSDGIPDPADLTKTMLASSCQRLRPDHLLQATQHRTRLLGNTAYHLTAVSRLLTRISQYSDTP